MQVCGSFVRVALLLLLGTGVSGCLTPATLNRARGREEIVQTRPELSGVERALMMESGTLRICARAEVEVDDPTAEKTEKSVFWIDVPLARLQKYAERKELEPARTGGFDSRAEVSNVFALKYVVRKQKFEEGCPDPGAPKTDGDKAEVKPGEEPAVTATATDKKPEPAVGSPAAPEPPPDPGRPVSVGEIDRPTFLKYRDLEPAEAATDTVYFSPIADGGGTIVYVSRDTLWQGPFELLGRQRGPEERHHLELAIKLETGKKKISIPAKPAYFLLVPFAAIADVALLGVYLVLGAG